MALGPWVACRAGLGRCALFVAGSYHATLRPRSGEAQGQVWLSPVIAGPDQAGRRHLLQLLLGARFCRLDMTSYPLHMLGRPLGTRGLVSAVGAPWRPTLKRGCPCTARGILLLCPLGVTKLGVRGCSPQCGASAHFPLAFSALTLSRLAQEARVTELRPLGCWSRLGPAVGVSYARDCPALLSPITDLELEICCGETLTPWQSANATNQGLPPSPAESQFASTPLPLVSLCRVNGLPAEVWPRH